MRATSSRKIETIKKPGRHSVGDGLYLVVSESGRKSWVLRYQAEGRRRDMGLGSYPQVSLADARYKAVEARRLISNGKDPIGTRNAARKAAQPLPTFATVAEGIIEDVAGQSTNEKVRYRARMLLGEAYCGHFLTKPVNSITATDVARLLNSVRAEKPETARKLYRLLCKVFETARVRLRDEHGVSLGEMPTNLKDLKALGFEPTVRNHRFPALDWREVPAFMASLRNKKTGNALRALEVAVLTGLRETEVAHAQWAEIDFAERVWTIPIHRLKDRKHRDQPHRVPLSKRVIEILKGLRDQHALWVFPGLVPDKPIASQSMLEALKKMNKDANGDPLWVDPDSHRPIVVHGFRSTLRTWAEEHRFRREVAEQSLGHAIGSKVESRYRRTDILNERRELMEGWAKYCESPDESAKVIPIDRKRERA